jgi:hypothetical protein
MQKTAFFSPSKIPTFSIIHLTPNTPNNHPTTLSKKIFTSFQTFALLKISNSSKSTTFFP